MVVNADLEMGVRVTGTIEPNDEGDRMRYSTAQRRPSRYDVRISATAHKLFAEFDELPLSVVIRAITRTRSLLREFGHVLPPPEKIELVARELLVKHQLAA